jgi:hypothetical protein
MQKTKAKHISYLNAHTGHSPRCDGPRGPPEWPSQRPPRAGSASLEGSRLPRAGSASLEGSPPPGSRLPHKCACSRTRVRAFNALTQQSRAITRLGITPRHCSANSLGETHSRHCRELCNMASVNSVTLCCPLPYNQHAAPSRGGGAVAPSNPFLVNLQGQTMTSGRRERHPRHCWSCAAVPASGAPRRALLQQL